MHEVSKKKSPPLYFSTVAYVLLYLTAGTHQSSLIYIAYIKGTRERKRIKEGLTTVQRFNFR